MDWAFGLGQPHPSHLAKVIAALSSAKDFLDPRARMGRHGRSCSSSLSDVGNQPFLVISSYWNLAMRRKVLSEHMAGPSHVRFQNGSNRSMQARRRAGLRSFPLQHPLSLI